MNSSVSLLSITFSAGGASPGSSMIGMLMAEVKSMSSENWAVGGADMGCEGERGPRCVRWPGEAVITGGAD